MRHLCLLALCLAPLIGAHGTELRVWKDQQAREVRASFGGLKDGAVTLRLEDGREIPFPLEQLSAEDQEYARAQASLPAHLQRRRPLTQRTWPEKVEVDSRAIEIEIVSENPEARKCEYRSAAFKFTSQDKLAGSVMKEIARAFEATRSLIEALPWGIVCEPPEELERYQAALYETQSDYFRNGGPQNSAGVYDSGDMIFKIPFPSLGLEQRGKTWFKNENYRNDTLVHELTHQMMHDYLPFLPKWMIEGTAEYAEVLPYRAGTFRVEGHKGAIKEHCDQMRMEARIPSLEEHLTMTREEWDNADSSMIELYFRSLLLVYFFNHLDGDGSHFIRYMDAVFEQVEERRIFFANPNVKRMPGGRFSFPSSMTPPDLDPTTAPFKHLPVLLGERSYADLAAAIQEGFRSIGLKVEVGA